MHVTVNVGFGVGTARDLKVKKRRDEMSYNKKSTVYIYIYYINIEMYDI